MKKNKHIKIGIIGAGAAGLAAAEALKAKGYQNIMLLEKESFAGGKCRSIEHEGRTYELGAGIIAANQKNILELAKKAGVRKERLRFKLNNLFDPYDQKQHFDLLAPNEKMPFAWQFLLRFRRLSHQYHQIEQPGFKAIDPALCLSFSDWTKLNNIELVGKYFERYFTGFGYGYINEIPAAYVLKYFSWETMKSFARKQIFVLPDGIQQIWQNLACNHDVRFKEDIKHIKRGDKIVVTTEKHEYSFDTLLWSAPLDETLGIMDSSALEKELFSRIKHYDYQTFALRLSGFPNEHGFIPSNFTITRQGHPLFWYKRFKDTDLYTMYVIGDWQLSEQDIMKNIDQVVKSFGGKITEVVKVNLWKYFPHLTTEDLLEGYYDQLESLQGKQNTFYLGELFNFSMVENTVSYARELVEQNF